MKPEEKLIELLENCVQKDGTADSEDVEIALKQAYNLGLETALDNVQTIHDDKFLNELSPGLKSNDLIYKPSILKLKL